jgi:predicted nuclease of predicted toxin-antitoxin system
LTGYLLDENLPRRLTFKPSLPVTHATDLAASPTDTLLWEHARAHCLAIVSKDADFSDRIMLSAPPPWVVRLAPGNLRCAITTPFSPAPGRESRRCCPITSC